MENCRKRACHGSVVKISCSALCQEIGYSLCHAQGRTKKTRDLLREHVSVQEFGTTDRIKNQDVRHTFCQKKQKKQKKHEDGFYKLQGRI